MTCKKVKSCFQDEPRVAWMKCGMTMHRVPEEDETCLRDANPGTAGTYVPKRNRTRLMIVGFILPAQPPPLDSGLWLWPMNFLFSYPSSAKRTSRWNALVNVFSGWFLVNVCRVWYFRCGRAGTWAFLNNFSSALKSSGFWFGWVSFGVLRQLAPAFEKGKRHLKPKSIKESR